jgi:copper homeostasis protein CutC
MDKQTISATRGSTLNEAERLELCRLLIKAGYTVKIGTVKEGNTTAKAVIFWRE